MNASYFTLVTLCLTSQITVKLDTSVCQPTHLVPAAVPRGYPRSREPEFLCAPDYRPYSAVTILGRSRAGNMQGNMLEQAVHGPTLFRCGEVPCMTVTETLLFFFFISIIGNTFPCQGVKYSLMHSVLTLKDFLTSENICFNLN